MSMTFTCPHCQTASQVNESAAGQIGSCAHCGATVSMPLRGGVAHAAGRSFPIRPVVEWCVGLLVIGLGVAALLLPSGQMASSGGTRHACSNNLKQIALALHNYHYTHGIMPPAYLADESGRPMHSWRVLILPFMEHGELYEQYDFDQPWDSPANRALCDSPLDFYKCPTDTNPHSTCNYFIVNVPDSMFEADTSISLDQVSDGTSNTILVVEVTGANVHWSQPYDLGQRALSMPINSRADGTVISSVHANGAQVVFGDGRVTFIPESTTQAIIRAMITKSDGQEFELDEDGRDFKLNE